MAHKVYQSLFASRGIDPDMGSPINMQTRDTRYAFASINYLKLTSRYLTITEHNEKNTELSDEKTIPLYNFQLNE